MRNKSQLQQSGNDCDGEGVDGSSYELCDMMQSIINYDETQAIDVCNNLISACSCCDLCETSGYCQSGI